MNTRASLNLELSLLIMLLVLVAVAALGWMGDGIANQYNAAAGFLTGADSYSTPDNGAAEEPEEPTPPAPAPLPPEIPIATPDYGEPISYRYNIGALRLWCSDYQELLPVEAGDGSPLIRIYAADDYAANGAAAAPLPIVPNGTTAYRLNNIPRGFYTVVASWEPHGCSVAHAPVVWQVAIPSDAALAAVDGPDLWTADYTGTASLFQSPGGSGGTLADYYAYLVIRQ